MDNKKDEFYSPPPKLSKGEQLMQFLWNSETNQFLGRTAGSWGTYFITFSYRYGLKSSVTVSAGFWVKRKTYR